MRMSRLLAPTLREVPADAEIASQQLLLRAGFIRRISPGVYAFLPLMWRVLRKIEALARQELDASGAQELLMPNLVPAELWQESGRWYAYGPELLRLRNRSDRQELLGPTHEETITAIAREELRSYRQLPLTLYQIQSKFRDENRPRFGLLRGREFLMKDAYSFHADAASLEETYSAMCRSYTRIFARCGLATRRVESDVGTTGGAAAHEFIVVIETSGAENEILYCDRCDYAANVDTAESRLVAAPPEAPRTRRKVSTPAVRTVAEQAAMLHLPLERIVKTLVVRAIWRSKDETERCTDVVALVRGDTQVNLVKLRTSLGCTEIRPATELEVQAITGTAPGFVGPFSLPDGVLVVADESLRQLSNFSTGAGEIDMHWVDANWDPAFSPGLWADIRSALPGEVCGRCGEGRLNHARGIEVGNTFKLDTRYSSAMHATYDAPDGSEQPFVMGCYELGITRTAQAAVEACHDDNGIQWPVAIAPYHLVIIPANPQDTELMRAATDLYEQATRAGIETVLDDRDDRAGVKFKDADLIGFPLRITVGKGLKNGKLELKIRATGELMEIPVEAAVDHLVGLITPARTPFGG